MSGFFKKYRKIIISVVATVVIVVAVLVGLKIYNNSHDLSGFRLTERESILAMSGGNHSFLFEIDRGFYELTLYQFQRGELVDTQIFAPWGAAISGRPFIGMSVYDRSLMTVSMLQLTDNNWTWSTNLTGMGGGRELAMTITENHSRSWGQLQRRVRLGEEAVPLLYVAFSDSGFPTALENIVAGNFDITTDVAQFGEVQYLFIITIRELD